VDWSELPRAKDPNNCVRWNHDTQRYEYVKDGEVRASISRLKMRFTLPRREFVAKIRKEMA
jgi:hypothetical protein